MPAYCKKCGRILLGLVGRQISAGHCDACGSPLYEIPDEFTVVDLLNDEIEQQFIEEYVKKSPEFDEKAFNLRDWRIAQRKKAIEIEEAMVAKKTVNAECPTCHSRNVQRISGLERGASILAFGIFSKKINKSFKCNDCGYTW